MGFNHDGNFNRLHDFTIVNAVDVFMNKTYVLMMYQQKDVQFSMYNIVEFQYLKRARMEYKHIYRYVVWNWNAY